MNLLIAIGAFIKSHIITSIVVGTVLVGGGTTAVLIATDVIDPAPVVDVFKQDNNNQGNDNDQGKKEYCSYTDRDETEADCTKAANNYTRNFYKEQGCTDGELSKVKDWNHYADDPAIVGCQDRIDREIQEKAEQENKKNQSDSDIPCGPGNPKFDAGNYYCE